MRLIYRVLMSCAIVLVAHPLLRAHHGFGTFDMRADIEVTGVVTGLDFVNPHSWLYLDVVGDDGVVVAWRCEMRSANTLRRSGWTPDLFPVGARITITGSPDREDPYSCYVSTVVFADGSSLDRYGQRTSPTRFDPGTRALRLANGEPNISGDWAQEQVVMTDPRGQIGTLVPLSEVEAVRAAGDLEARGSIPGARRIGEDAQAGGRGGRGQGAGAAGRGRGAGPAGRGLGGGSTLTAAGQAALDAREVGDRYSQSCVFRSIVNEWGGEPINRVIQRGDTISIMYGRLGVERTVHMTMREHPGGIEPSLTGHSIGRWEGDRLVVDTVAFAPGFFNGQLPHSGALHVVEEFWFDEDRRQLIRTYTAEDPLYWTQSQTGRNALDVSDVAYQPEQCEDLTIDETVELGPRR
jgi:hypothetical protein